MKKYITLTALLASAGTALALTSIQVDEMIILDGSQPEDARLEFKYSTYPRESLTTTVENVTIYGTDGFGMHTNGASLTFNVLFQITATNNIKLPHAGNAELFIDTNLTEEELYSFKSGEFVQRLVVKADIFESISNSKIENSLNIGNISDYHLSDGGLVYGLHNTVTDSWTYYSGNDIELAGNYATIKNSAQEISLSKGYLYTLAEIRASSGASVKGIGFIASASPIPEPSAFGLLAGLGAIALVGTRRRK